MAATAALQSLAMKRGIRISCKRARAKYGQLAPHTAGDSDRGAGQQDAKADQEHAGGERACGGGREAQEVIAELRRGIFLGRSSRFSAIHAVDVEICCPCVMCVTERCMGSTTTRRGG